MRGFLAIILCFISFSKGNASKWLESVLKSDTCSLVQKVIAQPEKFRLQLMVTIIDRDQNGYPSVKRHKSDFWPKDYFFPASTFKLPICFLALEKLKMLENEHININTDFYCKTDQCYPILLTNPADSITRYASINDLIVASLVFSDNYSPKILQEFIGKEFCDNRLSKLGLHSTILNNFPSPNKTGMLQDSKWAFWSPNSGWLLENKINKTSQNQSAKPAFVGEKSLINGRIINRPWDFSNENQIELQDLHHLMEAIVLPELNILPNMMLQTPDLNYLMQTLAAWPRNKQTPLYAWGDKLPDNFRKFLFIGDLPKDSLIPEHITIANKVGLAYGFMTDISYFRDKLTQTELIVSASIYVNENETINDGIYQYESIGLPFMGQIGRTLIKSQMEKKTFKKLKASLP
ncbi:MAG: serine hydrolase [Cytophagales bacterium]